MRIITEYSMIMLLIQSDMAKSLWLLTSPLYYFITKKPFSSNWVFCQISGFFLTATIEASDIAVLLIAIHTALFIVKRQHPGVAVGLQPYRRVAYTLWAVVPIILAALVPITGGSFVDNGPHCYLPIQPNWYREALAWVPRYIIFGFIIITYTWLYVYVHLRVRRFGEDQRRASNPSSRSTASYARPLSRRTWRGRSGPQTPTLAACHSHDSASGAVTNKNCPSSKPRQSSVSSMASTLQIGEGACLPTAPEPVVRKSSISWRLVDFDGIGTSESTTPFVDTISGSPMEGSFTQLSPNDASANSNSNITTDTHAAPVTSPEPTQSAGNEHAPNCNQHNPRRSMWERRLNSTRTQASDVTSSRSSSRFITAPTLQGAPLGTACTNEEDAVIGLELSDSNSPVRLPTEVSEQSMRRSRDKLQRQMRLLFVYPAIYMLTWIAPFVAHVYRYDDVYATSSAAFNSSMTSTPSTAALFNSTFIDAAGIHQQSSGGNGVSAHHLLLAALSPRLAANQQQSSIAALFSHAQVHPEPLALRIASMASLCIGAAADCGFFSAWERPWRHLRGGFWENLAMRLRVHRICGGNDRFGSFAGSGGSSSGGPGRNRDERVADERNARTRREKEREMILRSKEAAAAAAAAARESEASSSAAARRGFEGSSSEGGSVIGVGAVAGLHHGRRREWWDALDEAAI